MEWSDPVPHPVPFTIVAEIIIEANTFKLKGPDGNVEQYTARNPENLKKTLEGDLVAITLTEAMAIAVEKDTAE